MEQAVALSAPGSAHEEADEPAVVAAAVAADYCFGAAGDEETMNRNVAVLDRHVFTPRMLPGPATADLATEVTGGRLAVPMLVAPMGLQALMHPDGEAASAAAAARCGFGFCLSMFSSRGAAEVAAKAGPGVRWRQVYLLRDAGLTRQAICEAEQLGFDAVVLTLDVPVVGERPRNRVNRFDRFRSAPPAITCSPWWIDAAGRRGLSPRELLDDVFPFAACSWDDVASAIAGCRLPVLVKGILHPGDARRALAVGVSGIVVSNHGGRQLDRSVTAVEALPRVVDAVGGQVPVYFDSGVRRAVHVAVALGLGARAVLIGRPILEGLSSGGETGVAEVLRDFAGRLKHTMTLVGAATPADLARAEPHLPLGGERDEPSTARLRHPLQ